MTIPSEWLKDGAIVPVNNETVALLIKTLKDVPTWAKVSKFEEYGVSVKFNISVPFEFADGDFVLLKELEISMNDALRDMFKKTKGTYSNPRIDLNGRTVKC